MVVDGRRIADEILTDLTKDVTHLKKMGIIPTLSVILIGDNPASTSYIRQKQKAAATIGAVLAVTHIHTCTPDELQHLIVTACANHSIHGIIVQRPIPSSIGDVSHVLSAIAKEKDVDGFGNNSPFTPPVGKAVLAILKKIYLKKSNSAPFTDWLPTQNIVILGRGETAGAPINDLLTKLHCTTSAIHSKTENSEHLLSSADIIISCVGKDRAVPAEHVKPGVILISVGIWRDGDGTLKGDYNEEEMSKKVSFYTPTPGGVGPVNVACLMENLVKACIEQTGSLIQNS